MIRSLCAGVLSALIATSAFAAPVVFRNVPASSSAEWRTPDPEQILVIETTKGRVLVELAPFLAPNHVERIKTLTRQGLYDGRSFFRVIDGFMAQTGDPQETGEGSSALPDLAAEFQFRRDAAFRWTMIDKPVGREAGFIGSMPLFSQPTDLALMMADGKVPAWGAYCQGVVGMARAESVDSANSQFFLMRQVNHNLDTKYTAFGRVIDGLAVVRAIKTGEPVEEPRDRMVRVRVLADIPEAERPTIRIVDTQGAWFRAEMERERRARRGAALSPCDVEIPVEVR